VSLLPSTRLLHAGFAFIGDGQPGPFGVRGVAYVRRLGTINVMVIMPADEAKAHAMIGYAAPDQNVIWRNWSMPLGPSAHQVVTGVLEFVHVLATPWPRGVGASQTAMRRPPRKLDPHDARGIR